MHVCVHFFFFSSKGFRVECMQDLFITRKQVKSLEEIYEKGTSISNLLALYRVLCSFGVWSMMEV